MVHVVSYANDLNDLFEIKQLRRKLKFRLPNGMEYKVELENRMKDLVAFRLPNGIEYKGEPDT